MASELKTKLQDLLKDLSEKLKDLSTLDVTTLSGDINQLVDTDAGKYDLSKAIERLASADTTLQGKVYVVAATHVSVDMDSVVFVKSDLTADERILLEAHQKAVATAQEARNSFLHFAKSFVTGSAGE